MPPLLAIRQDAPILASTIAAQAEGAVVRVGFDVKPDGSTTNVKILSSTFRRANNAAVEAVERWRFQPVTQLRQAEVEIVFR